MDVVDPLVGTVLALAVFGVPLLGVTAAALALALARGRARTVAAALTAVGATAVVTFWWAWSVGFDAADAYRDVPGWVPGVEIGSIVTVLAAVTGLCVIALGALRGQSAAPVEVPA